MFPVQPPFPLASNLPFQPEAGSQTSILISESVDGRNVAATRQNSGRSRSTAAGPPAPRPPAGGVKAPAAMVCASVIVLSGNFRPARLSHDAARAGEAQKRSIAQRMKRGLKPATTLGSDIDPNVVAGFSPRFLLTHEICSIVGAPRSFVGCGLRVWTKWTRPLCLSVRDA